VSGIFSDQRRAVAAVQPLVTEPWRHRCSAASSDWDRGARSPAALVPRVLVTDKLGSYAAARRRVLRSAEHRQSKYLNNRAENSHQPTRQRE
jgi:putative transposase